MDTNDDIRLIKGWAGVYSVFDFEFQQSMNGGCCNIYMLGLLLHFFDIGVSIIHFRF